MGSEGIGCWREKDESTVAMVMGGTGGMLQAPVQAHRLVQPFHTRQGGGPQDPARPEGNRTELLGDGPVGTGPRGQQRAGEQLALAAQHPGTGQALPQKPIPTGGRAATGPALPHVAGSKTGANYEAPPGRTPFSGCM